MLASLITRIRLLLVRLYLYFHGVRFYTTERIPKTGEFKSAILEVIYGYEIEFFFYKEIYEDLIYRRGKIKTEKFIGYLIQAKIDPRLDEEFIRFNNLKIVFNSRLITVNNEKEVDVALLGIFISFMTDEIAKAKKNKAFKNN